MKLSFDWLSDYIDLSGINPQDLADQMTMGAFEVEEVTSFGPDIQGDVVVGEIVAIEPHPNADKIRLTKIRLADGEEPREIVCGAWNIEVGHRIPVALPGSVVINRHDNTALAIKRSKIRGVESNGMLCSSPELGIAGSGEGILILPSDTPLGTDARQLLHLVKDSVLHVGTRSNRGDALCVLGIAREVSVLLKRPLKAQEWQQEFAEIQEADDTAAIAVEIADAADCPFFTARILGNLKIAPSQAKIARRLEAVGVRPVSNVVDITNYVLQELGQPLHAYDLSQVAGAKLVTRRAHAGEKLVTIDGRERDLTAECLVISDSEKVVGVAGVMGGKGSEITDDTSTLILEAASFTPAVVRRSSRLLGLSSDSSLRFERGVDTASVAQASARASHLLVKYCGASLGKLSVAGQDKVAVRKLQLRMSELKRITEIDMIPDAAAELLEPLGFHCEMAADLYDAGIIKVHVPSFRQKDVEREIDLIEEVCRLWGYNRIPASLPTRTLPAAPRDPLPLRVKHALAGLGLNEAWLSSLISLDDLTARQTVSTDGGTAVKVLNPLSPDHQALRDSLLPGLLKSTAYNQDRGRESPWLFEVGRTYHVSTSNGQIDAKHSGTKEEVRVAAVTSGERQKSNWRGETKTQMQDGADDFYRVKGVFENLCEQLLIPVGALKMEATTTNEWFHPGRCAALKSSGGDLVGYLGEVHPQVAAAYNVRGRVCAFEVSLEQLSRLVKQVRLEEIYLTPAVERDLTVDLEPDWTAAAIESEMRSVDSQILRDIRLVSVFALSDAKKSLSFRLTFQHPSETLTANAVDSKLSEIRTRLQTSCQATFRT